MGSIGCCDNSWWWILFVYYKILCEYGTICVFIDGASDDRTTLYPIIGVIGTVGFAKVCFQEGSIELKKMDRFLISLMGVGIYTFSCLALYLSWTTVKSKEISGMQGRYLIPMILLLSLLGGIRDSKKNKENYVVDITISVVMIGMMLIVTAIRYY